MTKIEIGFLGLLLMALSPGPAGAWSHANSWGGSSHGTYGEGGEHSNAWGGSSAHAYGGGQRADEHVRWQVGRRIRGRRRAYQSLRRQFRACLRRRH